MGSTSGWESKSELRIDAHLFHRCGEGILASIIFLAPLVLGGRHPIGRLVYICLVTALLACWIGERVCSKLRWRPTGVEWLFISGALLLLIQCAKLPPNLTEMFSSNASELAPTWNQDFAAHLGLRTWDRISFTPFATWLALGVYLSHVTLFVVMTHKLRDIKRIPTVLRWIALSAVGMAILAIVQFMSGTDKFVWIFDHPSRPANVEVTGAFANTNHFTHFLALGLGPLIWWMSRVKPRKAVSAGPTGNRFGGLESVHDWWHLALMAGLTLVGIAGLTAKSRGGILVMFLATLVSILILTRLKLLSSRAWLALGGIAVLVLAGLTFYGYQEVRDELATLTSGSIQRIDDAGARQKIWSANLSLIQRFPFFGTGVGSHAEVYPKFFPHRSAVEFTHAESGFIQVFTETGWIGGFLLVTGLVYCGRWTLTALKYSEVHQQRTPEVTGCVAAIASGLAVSVFHSIFDFPWYLTSCMSLTIIMAAAAYCLCRNGLESDLRSGGRKLPFSDKKKPTQSKPTTALPFGMIALLVLLISFAWSHVGPALGAPHWDRYLKLSLNSRRSFHHDLLRGSSAEDRHEKMARQRNDNTRMMATHLNNCLKHHPTHPRAHARMTAACLQLFDDAQKDSQNAMALDQIRDAAIASQFPNREELNQWLDKAIGEPRQLLDKALYHSVRGHRITPVDGRGYIYLSRLVFLTGLPESVGDELLAAAEHVRPNDAFVLYQKGRESALEGDIESTLVFWRQSFSMSRTYRDEIIRGLAPHIPAPLFVNNFRPDEEGMSQLYSFYRRKKLMTHANIVGPLVVKDIVAKANEESGVPAAQLWHRCRSIYRFLGHTDKALECAIEGATVAPNWFEARMVLADEYMALEQYGPAMQQYQWCQQRKPFDAQIRQRLNIAETLLAKQQFAQQNPATTQPLVPRVSAQPNAQPNSNSPSLSPFHR